MPTDYLPVPHLEQNADADCLPTCAAMILAYLQAPVETSQLSRLFDTREFGTVAPHILRLADWGYDVTYHSGSLATLRNLLTAKIPAIIFVWTGNLPDWSVNTPHAMVVIGMDAENVAVNDPASDSAPRNIPIESLLLAWSEFDYRYATIVRRPS